MFGERPSNVFVLHLWRTFVSPSVDERSNRVISGVKMSPIVKLNPQTTMQSAIAVYETTFPTLLTEQE
jgi:hypothetical protein